MAYSESLVTIEAALPWLGKLLDGEPEVWDTDDSLATAYKLREVFYIARRHPGAAERWPGLVRAAQTMSVERISRTQVQARLKRGPTEASVKAGAAVPTHGLEEAGVVAATSGPQTADTIVHTWLQQQPSNSKLYFPQANLINPDLMRLWRWAEKQGLLFFESDGAITLQKKERGVEEYAWSPLDIGETIEET